MKKNRLHQCFTLIIFIFSSFFGINADAQRYTADFTSAPAFTAHPQAPSWLITAEVTLGNTPYTLTNLGNGGWEHKSTGGNNNGANLLYNTAATTFVTIQRKDGQRFKFYGVWLKYTNYISEYYLPPYLRVTYTGATVNGVAVPDEVFNANTQVTLNKDVNVTSVTLNFSGLSNLNFDDLIVGPAIVSTSTVNQFSASSALLGGTVAADATGVTERGYVVNTTGSPTTADTKIQCGSGTGLYSQTATGLASGTTYYVRAYAINSSGTAYGNQEMFTTAGPFTLAGTHYFNTLWISTSAQASPFTKYIEGWDITGVSSASTGLISVSRITAASAAEGLASVRILSGTTTENLNTVKIKANNGAAFDLQSFKFRYATRLSGTSFGTIKVTGFKNGSPVTGAQATLTGIAPLSSAPAYITIDLSGNTRFGNIDEFTIEAADPVNAARLYYADIDVLTVKEVSNVLSSNADLSNLLADAGSLSPVFSSAIAGYTVAVVNATNTISISPSVADVTASVKVNGSTVSSGGSVDVPLNEGSNTISIVVTAQDGVTSKTYLITVNRAAKAMVTSIIRNGAHVSNAASVDFTVSFDQAVTGLSAANFSLVSAGLSGAEISDVIAVSATQYTVSVNTGSGDGTLSLNADNASGVTPNVGNLPYEGAQYIIDKTSPVILGVHNGHVYNTNKTISFNEGNATLNSAGFLSGAVVSTDGTYTLTATDEAGNSSSVSFQIDKTAPEVTGAANGGSYKTSVTIHFNEGVALLNGNEISNDMELSASGSYILSVTDAAGNTTTVSFNIVPVITVTNVSKTDDCAGDYASVSYFSAETFNAGNVFNIELSDASGSFASPVIIGSYAGTSIGAFIAQFPSHLVESANYHVRVSSTNPVITGTEGSVPVAIHDRPYAEVIAGRTNANSGYTYSYTMPAHTGSQWQWFTPATLDQHDNVAKMTWIAIGNKQPVAVVETSQFGCIGDTSRTTVNVFNLIIEDVKVSSLRPCPGSDLTVTAKVSGVFNSDANEFLAQLSDASGSFAKAKIIGRLQLSPSGNNRAISIPATLPFPLANGNSYRIRIVANSLNFIGEDNKQDIQIDKPLAGADKVISKCTGSLTDLAALYTTAGLTSEWNTPDPQNVTAPGLYTLIVTNANGCKDTADVEVRDFVKPDLGKDTVVRIAAGSTIDLGTVFNTSGLNVKWNTSVPKTATAGRYRLIAANEGCRDTACVKVVVSSTPSQKNAGVSPAQAANKSPINLFADKLSVSVYPNPARTNSKLQVSGSDKGYSVTLSDLSGKTVWKTENIHFAVISLPVDRIATGIYTITVNNGTEIKTVRLVKE